jgi:hypothetical protein
MCGGRCGRICLFRSEGFSGVVGVWRTTRSTPWTTTLFPSSWTAPRVGYGKQQPSAKCRSGAPGEMRVTARKLVICVTWSSRHDHAAVNGKVLLIDSCADRWASTCALLGKVQSARYVGSLIGIRDIRASRTGDTARFVAHAQELSAAPFDIARSRPVADLARAMVKTSASRHWASFLRFTQQPKDRASEPHRVFADRCWQTQHTLRPVRQRPRPQMPCRYLLAGIADHAVPS